VLFGEPSTLAASHLPGSRCIVPSVSYREQTTDPEGPPMSVTERLDIVHHFAAVQDPRDPRFITHPLSDLLTIALCATLSGAKSFEDMAAFGRAKETWLRSLGLTLPHGIPSHDTFRDLFRHLAPAAFQDCFSAWINAVCARLGVKHVQIDGKAQRGSRGLDGTCLYLVSAWVRANSLTLGQVAVEDKSNEITAIPKLLKLLELNGALVSIDAIGCQKEIAQAIRDTGADYLLQVKGNQPTLEADINASFEAAFEADFVGVEHDVWVCESRGHGRAEERVCLVLYDLERLSTREDWVDVQAIVRVSRTRWEGDKETFEVAHYISSRRGSALDLGSAARGHWGIENGLHWVLDVIFREDDSRLKDRTAAENLGMLRRVVASLLRQDDSKGSVSGKLLRAAWDDDFRLHLLDLLSDESA
jgi:predicted transposase YbfD/YdcC